MLGGPLVGGETDHSGGFPSMSCHALGSPLRGLLAGEERCGQRAGRNTEEFAGGSRAGVFWMRAEEARSFVGLLTSVFIYFLLW